VAASLMQFSNDAAPSTGGMIINTLTNSGQGLGKFMLSSIIVGVASVFIILGYGLIAVQLLITLVESYLIIGGGALMLGFPARAGRTICQRNILAMRFPLASNCSPFI
jgi:type IV secretion system protein TrbL